MPSETSDQPGYNKTTNGTLRKVKRQIMIMILCMTKPTTELYAKINDTSALV